MASLKPIAGEVTKQQPNDDRYYPNSDPPEPPSVKKLWNRIRWLFVLNIGLAVASGFQAWFAHESNQLTRDAIANNVALTDKALRQAKQLNDASLATSREMAGAGIQAQERIANEQIAASTQTARDALMLERRAWVNVTTGKISPIPLTSPALFETTSINSGSTPALGLKQIEQGFSTSNPPCVGHTHSSLTAQDAPFVSTAVVGNGDDTVQGVEIELSPAEIADINAERKTLWVFGGFEYFDVFMRQHVTRYCLAYGAGTTKHENPVGICTCHNEAN